MAFIEIKEITKKYQSNGLEVLALDKVSLSINKGSISGIIGKSGAGKSALLHTINMLEKPSSGKIIVDDEDITQKNEPQLRHFRSQTGIIFQQFNLLQTKTVEQNIRFPLQFLQERDFKQENDRFDEIISITQIKELLTKYPSKLSGGQKQRVAIARALITNPKILLSDEATSALDPINTAAILNLLKKINNELHITILLITHELEVIRSICDTVFVMENGQIVESGNCINLFSHPKTDAAKELLGFNSWLNLPQKMVAKISLTNQPDYCPLIKLSFLHNAAVKPIIASLQKNYHLELNILQGDIKTINQEIIGTMLVKIDNLHGITLDHLIVILKQQEVDTEIIGYAPTNF